MLGHYGNKNKTKTKKTLCRCADWFTSIDCSSSSWKSNHRAGCFCPLFPLFPLSELQPVTLFPDEPVPPLSASYHLTGQWRMARSRRSAVEGQRVKATVTCYFNRTFSLFCFVLFFKTSWFQIRKRRRWESLKERLFQIIRVFCRMPFED